MKRRLSRYVTEYLDSKAIFALDLVLSVVASAFVLLILNFFSNDIAYHGRFAICWLISALVASIAAMLLMRSYNQIVRHTTLRDLGLLLVMVTIKDLLMLLALALFSSVDVNVILALFSDQVLTFFLLLFIRLAMTAGIRRVLTEKPEVFDPRSYLTVARDEIRKLVAHKINDVLGCAGKA